MPEATSEGFEATGQQPNAAYTLEDRDPEKCDPQTAEILMRRVNKALGTPETHTLKEALAAFEKMKAENAQLREALGKPWAYLHERFKGLRCGLQGTWEQAFNEIQNEILHFKQLAEKNQPPTGDSLALKKEDRAALIEEIPAILQRLTKMEAKLTKLEAKLAESNGIGQH